MADRTAVVVGGGITGVLTARSLAVAGFRVTLLEGAHLGAGSSSRTAAGIRQQFSTPETVRGMRYSVAWYRRFADEVEDRQSPLVQNGYLFLAGDAEQLAGAERRVAMQRANGLVEVELLGHGALIERFPWLDPEAVVGGTFCPTDGFLHPHLVYMEGARRCRELGVEVVQGAEVVGGRHVGGRLVEVETGRGRFGADLFLDCTNAFTGQLEPRLGLEPLPVAPLKRYLWFVKRDGSLDSAAFAAMPLVIAPTGVYCRPENRDSLLMGWAHDTAPEPGFTLDDQDVIAPGFSHNSGIDALPYEAWANLAAVVPAIGEFAGITATTSGYYGTTPDHNPLFGYDRAVPNVIRLVGFSGHGAMFGPFTAAVATALAEAGGDVDAVDLGEMGVAGLSAFRIGRAFHHAEAMVI